MNAPPDVVVPGALYVVATPIGNLGDLSARARAILANVGIIAAEDTRHTGALLQAFGISTPLVSLHEHNEAARTGGLLARLEKGETVALVSDAGTPLVSDPGFELVRSATEAGLRVLTVPGPSAAIAALSVSGLPVDRFAFEGFLPAKAAARRNALALLERETRTLVFYEAPHRLREVLADMALAFGKERRAAVARELTKRFETTYYGTLQELADRAGDDADMNRGELVLLVAGAAPKDPGASTLESSQVLRTLLEELPAAQAAKLTARLTGVARADLYALAVSLQKKT
jgi:16S rRNA (cytidine1402-2'-O)-methyltransferase